MNSRRFGRTGWMVSELGYGTWGLGGWTGSDDDQSRAALRRAVDLGVDFFDTAWGYGKGHSEKLVGELVRDRPEKRLFVATKVPPKTFRWPSSRSDSLDDCFPPDHVRAYVESSLENLGLPKVDLIQFHVWEDSWAKDESWRRVMDDLKSQGLVEAVGLSLNRWEPANGLETIKTGAIDAVQVIYNVFDQAPEDELFPLCRELDVAVIARVPFDEGTLTGSLTLDSKWPEGDWRNGYFNPGNLAASVARAAALRPDLPKGTTMAEAALRFVLSADVATVIPGMRRAENVVANVLAANAGALSKEELKKLERHRWDRSPTDWSQ